MEMAARGRKIGRTDNQVNFYQNMPDTIYNDLKEQGLILSEGAVLQLPPIRPPKPTLLRQIGGLLAQEFKIGDGPHPVVILPILNSAVLVGRANTLLCYKFELDKETGIPVFQQPKIENLSFTIKALHVCESKFLNDRGEVPFLIEAADRITLFYVDLKEYKLIERNSLSYSHLFSVHFLCEREVLLLTKELDLHHFSIQGGKMREKNKKISAAFPRLGSDQVIQHCQIVGSIDEEQDSVIALFYLIKKRRGREEQEKNFEVLKVKEYLRTFEGKIEPQEEDYTVMMNLHSCVLPEKFEIWCWDGFYCIETKHEILILKKKFKKYLFIDNVMEKIHDHNLKLNQGGIVSSYGDNSMELSLILFGDPKCNSKILDTIELNPEESEGFRLLWPFKNEKETCIMLAFERGKKLIFHNVIKMEPMKKMLDVVRKCDKSKISVVQEIAVNLGINRKDFYLTLWQSSKREIPDIYQFLLPCGDVSAIKKEIRLTMRRKKIVVPEFVKILEKIAMIIKHELKTNLSQNMLKEYIKNDFLLRKIKLKQKDKSLDHRDLDKVYNSSIIDIFVDIVKNDLYPEVKQVDPLHAMVDTPEKEVMNLGHVFQEFKIVILENYKKFVVDFLSNFTSDQLVNVVRNYSYLLPFYPFELNMFMHETEYKTEVELNLEMARCHNGQNLWFSHMNSIEFNRELSKERIEKELHEFYPTSKIADAINTLVNSAYGGSQKLRKHGLISCTIQEYKNKLKEIYNIKLFMKVCEYANETHPYEDDEISKNLVKAFKDQNKLEGEAHETVCLYTSMHKFMLKNDFCEKKSNDRAGFTTEELIQFTSEDLVALFFLENRQRKEFIFNEFRDLYWNLYGNPIKFNEVISKFIHSQNCSRIELEIFIKEILKKNVQFQKDNQPLIELLIDGFCMKLEIREDTDTKHFIELMEEIELSIGLGMKINKIMQIRRCVAILNIFHCEKFTYLDMLNYQQNNQIFKILLERYFTQQLKRDSVRIEDEEISLDYCRNMLTVLLYIQETIYYDVSATDLLLTYGEILIEWKQFDVIKGILYDEDVVEKMNIKKGEYIETLIRNALNIIYTDETIEFDEEVKMQINDILDIMQGDNPLKSQEIAKLKLVAIFEEWEVIIHPFDIHSVVEEWNFKNGREDFITNLFDIYIDKLRLSTLQAIYTYLEYTAEVKDGEGLREVSLNNTEYVKYILMFAQRLLKQGRYDQIIEIFAFVKQMNDTTIEYELLSEAFVKSVAKRFPEDQDVEGGRELIEYFTQNSFDDPALHQLFVTGFASGKFAHEIERDKFILVDSQYCFRKQKVEIEVELLWKVVTEEVGERREQGKLNRNFTEEVYYCYYFILQMFRNSSNGLRKLDKISFNLELLTNLLFRLESAIDDNQALWGINSLNLFKSFIKGLLLIGVARVKQADNITSVQFKQQEENIEVIKNLLKEDKTRNKDLLDSILRLETYINGSKNTKKNEKEIRFEKSKLLEQDNKPKEVEVEAQPEQVVNNATMNLRMMRNMKYEYTQMSNLSIDYISEKEVLEVIYNKLFEEREQARTKQRKEAGGANNNFLTGLNANTRKDGAQKDVIDKIIKEDFDTVAQLYSKEEIAEAVRVLYDNGTKDLEEVVNILDTLKAADKRKLDIGRLCKIYQGDIPTADLRRIFSFDFFLELESFPDEELGERAYAAISHNIQTLFLEKDNDYVRNVATFVGSVLESNVFLDRVFVDTLVSIGERYAWNPESVIRFRIIIDILAQSSPEAIKDNISKILTACKENAELRLIIKKELELVLKQHFPKEASLLELIRTY